MVPISNDQNGLEGEKMERFYVAILQLHRLTKVAFLSFFCCFIIDVKAVYAAAAAEKNPQPKKICKITSLGVAKAFLMKI